MNTSRGVPAIFGLGAILGSPAGSLPRAHVSARRDHCFNAVKLYPVATEAALRRKRVDERGRQIGSAGIRRIVLVDHRDAVATNNVQELSVKKARMADFQSMS